MSTTDPERPSSPRRSAATVDELFDASEPIRSAQDLARDGIFDKDEVEQFLADLYAMRRSDVA